MAFRRSVFSVWNGFDERIGRGAIIRGGEEHDAFYALLALGFGVAYAPNAEVYHENSSPDRCSPELGVGVAFLLHLFEKYPAVRPMLLRHGIRKLTGRSAPWRGPEWTTRFTRRTRRATMRAVFEGVALYGRSRIAP
jgi:GT2 family glycosyltransferase